MNTPNIHLFSTSEHFYFYDVNKNDLVMIPCHVYEMLKQGSENNEAPEIKELKQQGYLRSDYVKTQEHPVTPYLETRCNISVQLQICGRLRHFGYDDKLCGATGRCCALRAMSGGRGFQYVFCWDG